MNATVRSILLYAFLVFGLTVSGQTGTSLADCYRLAAANSAIAQNADLLVNSTTLKVKNIDASRYLPTLQWNARATWQNEVFGLPFEPPGIDLEIPKYGVTTNIEANYPLYDGGVAKARKSVEEVKRLVETQGINIELFKLREQVDRSFFSVLLIEAQAKSFEVTQQDLEAKKAQLEAAVRHGVALESEVLKLKVEQLKIRSKLEEMNHDRRAMLAVLGSLTGQQFSDSTRLEMPSAKAPIVYPNKGTLTNRPELHLFNMQRQQLYMASSLLDAQQKPKLSAFATTGFGYPDPLNFFDDKISPYFIGGVQFSWKFWDWKQTEREREILSVQSQMVENQQKGFVQMLRHQEGKFMEDIAKLKQQIGTDEEIAELQAEILKQLSSQLENGVATATDYLLQSDAELQARLAMEAHRVQLAQVEAAWRTHFGIEN
jgi:outer membrane protein TolC